MNKDRHIISEIRGLFAESDNTKAIQGVMNVMDHIQITQRQMGFAKAENCKFTAEQIFRLAVLFPFFSIKNARNYTKSMLGQLFMCHKDTIFVDVKTAYLSHRHNKFWDTKPVKHMNIAARRKAMTARQQR